MSYFILRIYSTTNDRDLSNMIARKDQKYVLPLSPKGVRIVSESASMPIPYQLSSIYHLKLIKLIFLGYLLWSLRIFHVKPLQMGGNRGQTERNDSVNTAKMSSKPLDSAPKVLILQGLLRLLFCENTKRAYAGGSVKFSVSGQRKVLLGYWFVRLQK